MKKSILIIAACLLASCGIRSHTKSKINIADFNAKQVHDTVRLSRLHNTQIVEIRLADGGFLTIGTHKGYLESYMAYYYPSGKLKSWELMAHGFKHGKSPLYDENGDLVSITDHDAPFKITLSRLSAKFAFGYGLDIFKEGVKLSKENKNDMPFYHLGIPVTVNGKKCVRYFDINGITGKIISDHTYEL